MAENFRKINGVVALLGNSIVTRQAKNYTAIEIKEKDGKLTTLNNVAISLTLDNYLNIGNEVELHLVKFKNKESYPLYIYGIKPKDRDLFGHIPGAFSLQKYFYVFMGIMLLAPLWTIPVSLYLFFLASKKSSLIKQMKKEIGQ